MSMYGRTPDAAGPLKAAAMMANANSAVVAESLAR